MSGSLSVVSFITWHQWHQPAWTLTMMGRPSRRARANASALHSDQRSSARARGVRAAVVGAPPQATARQSRSGSRARMGGRAYD